jgi:hypothetical protein
MGRETTPRSVQCTLGAYDALRYFDRVPTTTTIAVARPRCHVGDDLGRGETEI